MSISRSAPTNRDPLSTRVAGASATNRMLIIVDLHAVVGPPLPASGMSRVTISRVRVRSSFEQVHKIRLDCSLLPRVAKVSSVEAGTFSAPKVCLQVASVLYVLSYCPLADKDNLLRHANATSSAPLESWNITAMRLAAGCLGFCVVPSLSTSARGALTSFFFL